MDAEHEGQYINARGEESIPSLFIALNFFGEIL